MYWGKKRNKFSLCKKNITIKLSSFAENLCEKNICLQNYLKKNTGSCPSMRSVESLTRDVGRVESLRRDVDVLSH